MTYRVKANDFRWLAVGFLSLLLSVSVILILQNSQTTLFNIFTWALTIPLWTINLSCLSLGAVGGYLIRLVIGSKTTNDERKLDWQAQDAKLMASIASDKEKQLEAKIATLEAALKNALKKM